MTARYRWCSWLLWATMLASAASVRAQDAEAPAAQPPEPEPVSDPTVRILLDTHPTTPAELLRVVMILVDLDQARAAQPLVKRLADAKPDDQALAALAEEFGSATFLKLALEDELKPEGKDFSRTVLAAADRQARDPQRIAGLIERLRDPAPEVRQAAIARLRSGRDTSVAALVGVLADPARADEHSGVRAALAGLGSESLEPLVGVVRSADAALRAQAIGVLGRLSKPEASYYLLAPAIARRSPTAVRAAAVEAIERLVGRVPSAAEAAATLYIRAQSYYADEQPLASDSEGQVRTWHWDAAAKHLVSQTLPAHDASVEIALHLAGDARELVPRNVEVRRLHLAALLEAACRRAGAGQPLARGPGTAYAKAAAEGIDVLEDLLEHSAAAGHTAPATAAAAILGEIGDPEILFRRGPQPGALVAATRHADRRVRFAALEAVMKLDPAEPYPGSSYVLEALDFFARSIGAPRALVAAVRPEEARRQAGLLAEMGYEAETAATGRELVKLAIASGDYELLLVDMSLAAPTSGELVERIRRDSRTARLSVALVASSDDLDRAQALARRQPLTAAFVRPQDRAGMEYQVELLLDRTAPGAVPAEERRRQAAQSLAWLARLSDSRARLYNLRRVESSVSQALWVPELNPHAATVLAGLGTPASQRALVDLASQPAQPLAMRQAAARAFGQSISRHGTLLSTAEILLEYDRYNQSETLDKETQAVLGSILDHIEARAAADQPY